jgi:hypothetical protein
MTNRTTRLYEIYGVLCLAGLCAIAAAVVRVLAK